MGRKSRRETANTKDNEIHKDNLEYMKTDWNLHLSVFLCFHPQWWEGHAGGNTFDHTAGQKSCSELVLSGKLIENLWLDLEELQARPLPKANTGSRLANDFCEGQWYQEPYLPSIRTTSLPTWKSPTNCYCGHPTITWDHRGRGILGNVVPLS